MTNQKLIIDKPGTEIVCIGLMVSEMPPLITEGSDLYKTHWMHIDCFVIYCKLKV